MTNKKQMRNNRNDRDEQYKVMNSDMSDDEKLTLLKRMYNAVWLYRKVFEFYEKLMEMKKYSSHSKKEVLKSWVD